MIVWLNGPFGVGKTTAVHEVGKLLPDVATFDTEEVGFMVRHVLGPAFPGGDFQDLRAWRRITTDPDQSDAADWRLDHVAAHASAWPWLSQSSTRPRSHPPRLPGLS